MDDSPTQIINHPDHPHYPPGTDYLHRHLQLQLHYEMNLPPSENTVFKWLYAVNETDRHNVSPVTDEHGIRLSGNWLIFKGIEDIDHAWEIVKIATERGLLGYESLCRTAKIHEGEPRCENKVICVCTYNAYDEADVLRVRGALWHLGFTAGTKEERLKYKLHPATDDHIYYADDQDDGDLMYQD